MARLRLATEGQVDPYNSSHQKVLFKWLNEWGCRQFNKADHALAARSLEAWASKWLATLPAGDAMLETIGQPEISVVGAAYDDLRGRQAGMRTLIDGSASYVSYGPVGAAKTLFALRPCICPPWDRYTLSELKLDHSGASYCRYLQVALSNLQAVSAQAGVQIAGLPALVGRAESTPPKLIDEYYWATITRGFTPPSQETLGKWLEWAELG